MKKIQVPCEFGDQPGDFIVYIGRPAPGFHPAHYQSAWLKAVKKGTITAETMDRMWEAFKESIRDGSKDQHPSRP